MPDALTAKPTAFQVTVHRSAVRLDAASARLTGRWTRLGQSEVRTTDTESERYRGEVLERPNRRAWKARRVQALVGSNPTLSANI